MGSGTGRFLDIENINHSYAGHISFSSRW